MEWGIKGVHPDTKLCLLNLDLYKRRPHKDIRKYNFTYRVVSLWNSLPSHVVNAPTLNTFKNRLDRIWANEEVLYKYRATIDTGRRTNYLSEEEEPTIED